MKPVRVDKAGWQIACWKLAQARKRFEVEGFNERHQRFGLYLCATFPYEIKRGEKKCVFEPLPEKESRA
jgi:hypothetical protein